MSLPKKYNCSVLVFIGYTDLKKIEIKKIDKKRKISFFEIDLTVNFSSQKM